MDSLIANLRLPVLAAPMFRVSTPDLVIAQCRAGIIGSMPSRSVHDPSELTGELRRIRSGIADIADGQSKYAVNLVVHTSNPRLVPDLQTCIAEQVPIIITSLGVDRELIARVQDYGGIVFHDVTSMRHARHAIAAGVDGLVTVCAGAGGHTGRLSPFAFIRELRREYNGIIVAAGAIADGHAVRAAITLGADLAYMGTRFIACDESAADAEYRDMVIRSGSQDVVESSWLTGIPANFLAESFRRAGLNLAELPPRQGATSIDRKPIGWDAIWGAGQGVGAIDDAGSVETVIEQIRNEYLSAGQRGSLKNGGDQP